MFSSLFMYRIHRNRHPFSIILRQKEVSSKKNIRMLQRFCYRTCWSKEHTTFWLKDAAELVLRASNLWQDDLPVVSWTSQTTIRPLTQTKTTSLSKWKKRPRRYCPSHTKQRSAPKQILRAVKNVLRYRSSPQEVMAMMPLGTISDSDLTRRYSRSWKGASRLRSQADGLQISPSREWNVTFWRTETDRTHYIFQWFALVRIGFYYYI